MTHLVDVPFLLHAAEQLDGDPQVDDLSALFAAVGRHSARAMERDVCGSDHMKAAALLHTLVRLPALEYSNLSFAWFTAAAFLSINGHTLDYDPNSAAELTRDAAAGRTGIAQVARQLRDWTGRH